MDNEELHQKHRRRLKERFLKEGLSGFEDHNVLELLLFYALAGVDTNPLAHRLMKRYGTLSAVFDAAYEDLLEVPGVGEHTALLLKLVPELSRRYCTDRFSRGKRLGTYDEVGRSLVAQFLGVTTEEVFGMFFDDSLRLTCAKVLHHGSLHAASFTARQITECAIRHHASYLILAHNHPQGIPIASAEDLDATHRLSTILRQMDLVLLEHFIVAEDRFTGIDRTPFDRVVARINGK